MVVTRSLVVDPDGDCGQQWMKKRTVFLPPRKKKRFKQQNYTISNNLTSASELKQSDPSASSRLFNYS